MRGFDTAPAVQGGWGYAPGTFGELVQGQWEDIPYLVTLPIHWGTRARFIAGDDDRVEVFPPYRQKARQAAELACRLLGKPGGWLSLSSVLPLGKGLASSSADVVAAMRAVAVTYGSQINPSRMAEMAAQIEPSDGVMYPGVCAFDVMRGRLLERFGPTPRAVIVGILGPGRVNTVAHHHERIRYSAAQQARLMEAIEVLRQAVPRGDWEGIGRAGRISADVELERSPHDALLSDVLEIADREHWGVVIAHSGTARGFLFGSEAVHGSVIHRAIAALSQLNRGPVYRFSTWSGKVPVSGRLKVQQYGYSGMGYIR